MLSALILTEREVYPAAGVFSSRPKSLLPRKKYNKTGKMDPYNQEINFLSL